MKDTLVKYETKPKTEFRNKKEKNDNVLTLRKFYSCPVCGGNLIPLGLFGDEVLHKCEDCGVMVLP